MASILDLFNKSDKNRDYTSPDKTPMSTGMGMEGTKDIDPTGTYYKDSYKFGTNYSTETDKQKGKDLTPISVGNSEDGSKAIDTSGRYYKDPYKFGTNYSTDADNQKGKDLTPFSLGNGLDGSKNIDPSGTYYKDPYKFGTNYSTETDNQKGKDLTPISEGKGLDGSKNIDRGGIYYKDPYKFGTNYSTEPDNQKGKDLTPLSEGKGLDGSKNIDKGGTYYKDPYKFGTNYSTESDKQKGKDLTPLSLGIDIGGEKNIDPKGKYYTDPYIFGTNYSTDVDNQKGKDLTPLSTGNDIGGEKNIDPKGIYYTDPYKFGTNYSTDVDKQKGKDLTPLSLGPGSLSNSFILGSNNIDPRGKYYTDPYIFGTNYSTDVDKQKGKDLTPLSTGNDIGGEKNIDPTGKYYTDAYKFGTNYSIDVDSKQKGKDLTPFSLDSGNIDPKGKYYTDSYKFGIEYPTAVDKQINNEDPFQITLGNSLIGTRSVDIGGVRNGTLKLAKILPKKAFTRVKNVLDQELSGLRIKHLENVIDIYGTDLIRITSKRTKMVEDMKEFTGGRRRDGIVGTILRPLSWVKNKISNIIGVPRDPIPTTVVEIGTKGVGIFNNNKIFFPQGDRGNEQRTMENLAKIANKADGNFIGRFLAQNTGTPKQIVSNAVGSVASGAKKVVRSALFGRGTTLGSNDPEVNSSQRIIYGSGDFNKDLRYTKTMEEFVQKESGKSPLILSPKSTPVDLNLSFNPNPSLPKITPPSVKNTPIGKLGYPTLNLPPIPGGAQPDASVSINYETWFETKNPINKFNLNRKYDRRVEYLKDPDKISSEYDGEMRNAEKKYPHGFRTKFNKKLFEIGNDSVTYDKYIDNVNVSVGGIRFNNAAISGLSETFSPSWTSFRMVGSPFNSYVYESIERSVGFTIKLYALNPKQHKENWDKIQKLTNLVYPIGYRDPAGAVVPPVTTLTIGTLFIKRSGFIDSLTYNIDDEFTWELGRGKEEVEEYKKLFENYYYKDGSYTQVGSENPNIWKSVNDLGLVVNYKTPKLIEIQISFKIIESRGNGGVYNFTLLEKDQSIAGKATEIEIQSLPERPGLGSTGILRANKLGGSFGKFGTPGSLPGNLNTPTNNKLPNVGRPTF